MDYRKAILNKYNGIEERNGSYRGFIKECGHKINLVTRDNYYEAAAELDDYRITRYERRVSKYERDLMEGVVIFDDYVIYPSGNIFSLRGNRLKYRTDGFRSPAVTIKGKTYNVNTLYRKVFGYPLIFLGV